MATRVAVDACTVISIEGCGALQLILRLARFEFLIGPIVLLECGDIADSVLAFHLADGTLTALEAESIPVSTYLDLLDRFRLGDGETECLTIGTTLGCMVATDDLAARNRVTELLGPDRLTGSLGLLRETVREHLIEPAEALHLYLEMKRLGSFLPAVDWSFFES